MMSQFEQQQKLMTPQSIFEDSAGIFIEDVKHKASWRYSTIAIASCAVTAACVFMLTPHSSTKLYSAVSNGIQRSTSTTTPVVPIARQSFLVAAQNAPVFKTDLENDFVSSSSSSSKVELFLGGTFLFLSTLVALAFHNLPKKAETVVLLSSSGEKEDKAKGIAQSIGEAIGTPIKAAGDIYDSVTTKAGELGQSSKEKVGQAYNTVADKTANLAQSTEDAAGGAYDTVSTKSQEFAHAGQDKATKAYDTVTGKGQEIRDSASGDASDLSKEAKQQAGDANKKIGDVKDQAESDVESGYDAATKKAGEVKDEAKKQMESGNDAVADKAGEMKDRIQKGYDASSK